MPVNILLVVSKYKEDVSWINSMTIPALVYDKFGRDSSNSLPNIGRETHTYLHHILSNYPLFPEYTVFLQGNPFPHLIEGMTPEKLEIVINNYVAKKIFFRGLADYTIRCDLFGRPHNLEKNKEKWIGYSRDIPLGDIYKKLFSGSVPQSFHCRAPAGLFLVHSSRILCRSKMFYEKAMELVIEDPLDEMNTGHAFERLWYIIFNGYLKINKFL